MDIKKGYMNKANYLMETYEMDDAGDITEEHAKAFLIKFIEASSGEMGYPDTQSIFNAFIKENEAEEHREIIAEAISDLCEKISLVR